ncbi:hypothetical protein PMAYCL1PPCAC_26674, partial [Pristionchus mayeri]
YVCKDKLEEVKTVHDCLESDTTDPLSDCSKVCEVTEHVPLRLDSTATAPVNPNVPAEGTGPLCGKQMCVLKCAREQLNKQCAGAGDLFKEIARHQVEIGWDMLQAQSENTNDTASQLVALSYLANIPEKCVYLTNLETFDKEIGGDMMKKQEMQPGMEFSNDTSIETESSPDSSPVMDGFDPSLFEFAPVLEPDVPLGPPKEDGFTTSTTTVMADVLPEEDVKIIGEASANTTQFGVSFAEAVMQNTPSTTTSGASLAAAVDSPTDTMGKTEEGVHAQPKPSEEAPSTTGETDASIDDTAETTDSSIDKESVMGTRPVTSEPSNAESETSGLIPSRPVTEEDKDAVEEEAGPGKSTVIRFTTNGNTDEIAAGAVGIQVSSTEEEKVKTEEGTAGGDSKTSDSVDEKAEEAEKGEDEEMADGMGDEVEKEVEEGATGKDSEGAEMSTESTIVVDDENESELEANTVSPVTEKAKVNSAPASISSATAMVALVAVMFF